MIIKRYVIIENNKSIVSLAYGHDYVETLFKDVFKANEVKQKLMKARPTSKFRVLQLDIT